MPSPPSPGDSSGLRPGPTQTIPGRNVRGLVETFVAAQRDPDHRRAMRLSRRGLTLPHRPRGGDPDGAIWAVTMVKNEADIIAETVRHLLRQGVDRVLVVDNGSTDATPQLLAELAATDPRVVIGRDDETGYYQAAKMTLLSRYAARNGASWVIPFDADEFWFAVTGTLPDYLRQTPAGVASAALYNVWPTADPDIFRMEDAPHEYPKVAFRPHPMALLRTGNHWVSRHGERSLGLRIAHYPWRSFEQFARKVRQGAAAYARTTLRADQGMHWRTMGEMADPELVTLWQHVLEGTHDETLGWSPVGPFTLADPRDWACWQGL